MALFIIRMYEILFTVDIYPFKLSEQNDENNALEYSTWHTLTSTIIQWAFNNHHMTKKQKNISISKISMQKFMLGTKLAIQYELQLKLAFFFIKKFYT